MKNNNPQGFQNRNTMDYSPKVMNPYDDEINIYELLMVIKNNWKIIAFSTVVFTLGAIYYGFSQPNIYKSTTTFFVPKAEGQGLSMGVSDVLGSSFGFNLSDTSVDLVDNLLKSRRMQRDIVQHFELVRVYDERSAKKQKKALTEKESTDKRTIFRRKEENIIGIIKNITKVQKDKSNFMKLSVENEDKVLAAKITNYYLENLENINEELKLTTMKPMVKIIDRAEIPILKSKPKRSQIIMIGTILGLFGGIFLSFFIEAIKNKNQSK